MSAPGRSSAEFLTVLRVFMSVQLIMYGLLIANMVQKGVCKLGEAIWPKYHPSTAPGLFAWKLQRWRDRNCLFCVYLGNYFSQ